MSGGCPAPTTLARPLSGSSATHIAVMNERAAKNAAEIVVYRLHDFRRPRVLRAAVMEKQLRQAS